MKVVLTAAFLAIMVASCEREKESVGDGLSNNSEETGATGSDPGDEVPPPDEGEKEPTKGADRPVLVEKKPPVAEPVPGQPGFVKSPYNGKIVDVKGIPAGTLVADPFYPAEEKKHFRVPEMSGVETDPITPPAILDPSILINPGGARERPERPPEESEEAVEPEEAE